MQSKTMAGFLWAEQSWLPNCGSHALQKSYNPAQGTPNTCSHKRMQLSILKLYRRRKIYASLCSEGRDYLKSNPTLEEAPQENKIPQLGTA